MSEGGAPEGIEFSGSTAFCAPQFGFDALDGVGLSEAGEELRDVLTEGAPELALLLVRGG